MCCIPIFRIHFNIFAVLWNVWNMYVASESNHITRDFSSSVEKKTEIRNEFSGIFFASNLVRIFLAVFFLIKNVNRVVHRIHIQSSNNMTFYNNAKQVSRIWLHLRYFYMEAANSVWVALKLYHSIPEQYRIANTFPIQFVVFSNNSSASYHHFPIQFHSGWSEISFVPLQSVLIFNEYEATATKVIGKKLAYFFCFLRIHIYFYHIQKILSDFSKRV